MMRKQKMPSVPSVERKLEELRLLLEKKCFVLFNKNNCLDTANCQFKNVIIRLALAIGGIQRKVYESKLSQKTKGLIEKRRKMIIDSEGME